MVSGRLARFDGEIAGFGTATGHRVVVGRWTGSPFGPFADVMHEAPDGTRTLLAPSDEIAGYVAATYRFDRVVVVPVAAERSPDRLRLAAGDLRADLSLGPRTPLGWALRAVPSSIARSRWWCGLVDPVARGVLAGVRTRGTAGNGRREWYGATDQRGIVAVRAALGDRDLGPVADVWPPVRFGFGSAVSARRDGRTPAAAGRCPPWPSARRGRSGWGAGPVAGPSSGRWRSTPRGRRGRSRAPRPPVGPPGVRASRRPSRPVPPR